jgi:hypothetical protein
MPLTRAGGLIPYVTWMCRVRLHSQKRSVCHGEHHSVVAIYNTHTEAESAIKERRRAAFDIAKLSIVGKDYHTEEHVVGYYNAGDRMKYWDKLGAL